MMRRGSEARALARRALAVVLAGALLGPSLAPRPAEAQPSGKPAEGAKSSDPAKPSDPAKLEQAKEHMAAGSAFYNDPSGHKCEEALVEFGKAYELSGSWKALRAMGICELELERDGDAIVHFEKVLQLAGSQLAGADRTQLENDLRALKSAVATLSVSVSKSPARLTTTRTPASGLPKANRYTIGEGSLVVGIHPGLYTFTVSAEGASDVTWQAEVANGSKLERKIELVAAAAPATAAAATEQPKQPAAQRGEELESERPVPVSVWVLGGAAVACGITSGVFMGLSTGAKSTYDDANGSGTVPVAELESMRSDVVTKSLVADVMLGATVATAGAAVVLYLLRPEAGAEEVASIQLLPTVSHEGGGLLLGGAF